MLFLSVMMPCLVLVMLSRRFWRGWRIGDREEGGDEVDDAEQGNSAIYHKRRAQDGRWEGASEYCERPEGETVGKE